MNICLKNIFTNISSRISRIKIRRSNKEVVVEITATVICTFKKSNKKPLKLAVNNNVLFPYIEDKKVVLLGLGLESYVSYIRYKFIR